MSTLQWIGIALFIPFVVFAVRSVCAELKHFVVELFDLNPGAWVALSVLLVFAGAALLLIEAHR